MRKLHPQTVKNYLAYRVFRHHFLGRHPYCELFSDCFRPSSEIHHMKGHGYRGNLLCAEEWCKAACPGHHRWVEEHKIEARKLGLILYK